MTKQAEGVDPVVAAMIARIPPAGSVWPTAERSEWIMAMFGVFDMVYGPTSRSIEIVELPALVPPKNSAEPTDEAMARDVVAASGSREDAAETTEAPAKPWVGSERSSSAETDRPAHVELDDDSNEKTPSEPDPPPVLARKRREADEQLRARPPGCPGNLELATKAIAALGPASAAQIRNWVAKNYWSMVPDTWPGCLYNFVSAGKLGRQGINFIVVEEPRASSEPAPVQPKPAPKPAPPAPSKPAAAGIKFEHNGRHTMLGDTHSYAIANRLRAAMGRGHIPEEVLADKTFGSNTQTTRDRARMACTAMNDRLAEVGLKIERYPDYGYVMKEV